MPWFSQEYAGALRYMGLEAPVIVDAQGFQRALGAGDVDRPLGGDDRPHGRDARAVDVPRRADVPPRAHRPPPERTAATGRVTAC
jgi:hypothetical protein